MTENIARKKNTGEPGNGGQFGSKQNDEAAVALSKEPAMISVRLEAWDGRDEITVLDTIEFDGRVLLDAVDIDEINPGSTDNDQMFYEALRLGLAKNHDGPFTVYLDSPSVEAYIAEREAAGATDAITGTARRNKEQIDAALLDIAKARQELDRKEVQAHIDMIGNLVAEEFPTATEVELYVSGDGDTLVEIRDAEGITLWDYSDGDSAIDKWVTELNPDLSVFTQPANSNTSHPWRGILIGR